MRAWRHHLLRAAAALLAAGVAACATPPPASDPEALADFKQTNDPLEPTNRVFYAVNNGIDAVLLRPLAVGYRWAVPRPVRTHVHNVLENLDDPVTLVNDMMQGKPRRAGDTLVQFVINSTVGIAGIFDVADGLGYPGHDTDFGLTLATWGMPEGPFLFLPVLGPSDPRDAFGFGMNIALDPFTWAGYGAVVAALGYTRYAFTVVDARTAVLGDLEKVKEQALDPYATFRSLYRQHRHSQADKIRDDNRATTPAWYPAPAAH